MMKIISISIITVLSILNLFCSGIQITEKSIRKELLSTADSIRKDRNGIYKLDSSIIGEKGYFYLVRNNGIISYHPKKALINSDFSRYPFMQKILKDRNGCLSFNADGVKRYIFFSEIDSGEILCLTIDSSEFTGTTQECEPDNGDNR